MHRLRFLILFFLLFILFISAAVVAFRMVQPSGEAENAQEASGQTPIRHVICLKEDQNCFVAARFLDIVSCERHLKFWAMECRGVDRNDGFTCQPTKNEDPSRAYCLP